MKARFANNLFAAAFLLILFLPLLCGALAALGAPLTDTALGGYFEAAQKPALNAESFLSGEYQSRYNDWWHENFTMRTVLLRTYNQFRYSLFKLGSSTICAGKNNVLFTSEYLVDAAHALEGRDMSLSQNAQKMEEYVGKLQTLCERLAKYGKKLILYITPSKAVVLYDSIPFQYRLRAKDGSDTYIAPTDYLVSLLRQTDIPYLDTREALGKITGFPLFCKTGIHWTEAASTYASAELLELIEDTLSLPIKKLRLDQVSSSPAPSPQDVDIYNMLNIFSGDMDERYYSYQYTVETPEQYLDYDVTLQGGSFSGPFVDLFSSHGLGGDIQYISYDTFNDYTDGFMLSLIDSSEIFIIELNEYMTPACSQGYADYLLAQLDAYQPIERTDSRFDENQILGDITTNGYHAWEGAYSWVAPHSEIIFYNRAVAEKGLEILFSIDPSFVADCTEEDYIRIYVNGKLLSQLDPRNAGAVLLTYPSWQIPDYLDLPSTYNVTIECSFQYVPEGGLVSSDIRDMSLAMQYIGEARK